MAYADTTFYRSTYIGRVCTDDATLNKWLSRASDDLDIFCVNGIDVDTLTVDQLDKFKKACCAQAENYVIFGDGSDGFDSFSLGSFSVKKSENDSASRDGVLCGNAQRYLFAAGLSFRGVRVCNRYHAPR